MKPRRTSGPCSVAGVVVALVLAANGARGEDPPRAPDSAPPFTSELTAIRDRIVSLDLEGAISAATALAARPGISDDVRADALALRADAHVASGELEAAEADYREILPLRPSFAPDPSLTTKKALERFRRVEAAIVGTLHLDLDPRDAELLLDDRPLSAVEGVAKVVAGERRLKVSRRGFDALEKTVHAAAGQETLITIRLVPNARGVVVRTDLADVEVLLDDVKSGVTAFPPVGSEGPYSAELVIPDVPIGEHTLRLRKSCFARESIPLLVSVDLTDRAPKRLAVVGMRPSATRVTARGADYPGELSIDGRRVASLPLANFAMCPGSRSLEVVAAGRPVWSGTIEAEENDLSLDLAPRPNVVLVGAEWPASWAGFVGGTSLRGRVDPPAGADLGTRDGWRGVVLPPATDLAIAVIRGPSAGASADVFAYAPSMATVAPAPTPPSATKPRWVRPTIGASLVDAANGTVIVAKPATGGSAERAGLLPGDRIVSVGEVAVRSVSSVRDRLATIPPGGSVVIDAASPGAPARPVTVAVGLEPRIDAGAEGLAGILRAAWAAADGAAGGADAGSALANLAALIERSGRPGAAAEVWKRAKAIDGAAFSLRAEYANAAALIAAGKLAEAKEQLAQVRDAGRAAGDRLITAAAIDRLADLGVPR